MIAKLLTREPHGLFLDESTAGVDVTLRKDLWALKRWQPPRRNANERARMALCSMRRRAGSQPASNTSIQRTEATSVSPSDRSILCIRARYDFSST